MNNFRLLLLIASLGVPGAEGFLFGGRRTTTVKADHLKYINGEEISFNGPSLVIPLSPAKLTRKQRNKGTSDYCNVDALPTSRGDSDPTHYINNRHSSSDWLHNLKTLPNSSVLREVRNPVITLTVWATMISVVYQVLMVKGKIQIAANMAVPMVAHSLLVSSLGLLLVFRTNSSYQRFLEGRKIWEKILTISRNLSRLATLYRDEIGDEHLTRMKNLLASFPYLLRHHIRSGCLCRTDPESVEAGYKLQLEESCGNYIDSRYEGDHAAVQNDIETIRKCFVDRRDVPWKLLDDPREQILTKVSRSSNRPLWICDRLGLEIKNFNLGSRERLTLLKSVDELSSTIGQCERIRQTAVPLNYARHALRSLTLWLFTLPFCMVKDLGLLTGLATGIIAWVLFGIYQIGYAIEDPFQKSLRLSILCDAIRRDVLGDEMGDRNSAFCIDDGDDNSMEVPEPRAPNGLDGKPGDFLLEADTTRIISFPPLPKTNPVLVAAMRP